MSSITTTSGFKPRLNRPVSARNNDPKDELLKKFSKNLRKVMEVRDNGTPSRTVKFNPEIIDVSIGGTETKSTMNMDISSDVSSLTNTSSSTNTSSMSVSTCSSTSESDISVIENPKHTPKIVKHAVPSSVPKDFPAQALGSRLLSKVSSLGMNPECFRNVDFDTPQRGGIKHRRSNSCEMDTSEEQDESSVTVAVRVRPLSDKEKNSGAKCPISMSENETLVASESGQQYRFAFDYSFWSFDKIHGIYASQEHVYNALGQPLLGRAFEGYNVCLFAYGQTGSGKSYSIMGTREERGVIPRFCEELFGRLDSHGRANVSMNVEISFFEIYNEKIHDLLALANTSKIQPGKRLNLKVREDPVHGPFVENLSKYVVRSYEDVKGWLSVGNKHRATAATGMNEKSSRSHSVFTIVLTQTTTDEIEGEEHDHSITSKINLVDLAGSERQSYAKTSGDRLREGASINKSLHTLGKVISLLSDSSNSRNKKKKVYIPYRDSVLTWLLKESLGGNSKTAMLATIGPSETYIEESLSTLRYAQQARLIINMAKVNEDSNARLIRELRAEIDRLRSQTGSDLSDTARSSLAEITALKEHLRAKEREMVEMTRSWQERLLRSEERKLEEARLLKKSGISFQVDNNRPSLVNLNEDPQLSETLLYILKDGKTTVGRNQGVCSQDIQLTGPLIAENHCLINHVKDTVKIKPVKEAQTYVNGSLITEETVLHHGDRVILGGDHYFRLNHPVEAQRSRKSEGGTTSCKVNVLTDFEFAKQELIRVQESRLQEELEAAKRVHLEEMEQKLERERSVAQRQMEREMARKRQEAEEALKQQQSDYEKRLAELERALREQMQDKQETEQDRLRAQERVKKLEKEKQMLETEVLSNMKKLEEEAKASRKNMAESRHQHSRLVDQLERERKKIQKDVERIEQLRIQRGNTPSTPRFTPAKTSKPENLYRFTLLLREANKISQHFKKDVTYSLEEVGQGDEAQRLIRITNTKLNISTFWPMHKFEAKLLHMREVFQSYDPDLNAPEADEVFCDMNDTWARADRGVSPQVIESLSRGPTLRTRLSFNSASSVGSLDGGEGGVSTPKSVPSVKSSTPVIGEEPEEEEAALEMPTVAHLCRDLISSALSRFTELTLQESVADKMIIQCEILKTKITNMLEAFNQATEERIRRHVFIDSPVMRINSIEMATHLEVLLSQSALWVGSYESLTSGLIRDLCSRIMATTRKLGTQLVLFLQGCENDIDTLVQESARQALNSLFSLSKYCGELALATETSMICLTAPRSTSDSVEEAEIEIQCKVGHDIRQSFLSGCDMFIDKTLHGGLKTVEECELRIQYLIDDSSQNISADVEAVTQQVALTMGCAKSMLVRCQQLQVDLDATIQDTLMDVKPESYYNRSYQRAQGLISHITNLTDTVTHLAQATDGYITADDSTPLRKIARCAELIQKSTAKLIATSNSDPIANSSFSDSNSSPGSTADMSILSESRIEQLDAAAQELQDSTSSLLSLARRGLEKEPSPPAPIRSKRILPSSPVKGTGVTRRNSFSDRSNQKTVQALKRAFENGS